MSKHTPGPWRWETEYQGLYNMGVPEAVLEFEPFEGMRIEYRKDHGRREANASLIAAAPDLLEAPEALRREIILSDVDMDYIAKHFQPHIDKAAAAIAKARGES